MDIYKYAAQNRLRFPSDRGLLTVEQLFTLPLKGELSLDQLARQVNKLIKESETESFVEEETTDPTNKISLEILKDIIKTKQDADAAVRNRLQRAAERKKILDAMAAKKDQALTSASMEELEKKLAELDA